jgi:hypothetical protein
MELDKIREKNDIILLLVLSKELVPEDSVRPGTRMLIARIRRKGFVGSLEVLFFNISS